ncbi:hypothetical protein [Amycolatopsis sp. NPDC051128]|uniref:hypothetical protein n=1 Tax=Amycolatopsis sp. NPDC051128 TaxID=3155412 RepID=UPI00342BE7C9
MVVTVVAILYAGWWLIFKYNAYSPDKGVVEKDARQLLNVVHPKGVEVYSSFLDAGCESNTVGLRTDTSCSFQGYKYFKSSDPLAANLKNVDAQIIGAGWKRTFNTKNRNDLDFVLSGQDDQSISYLNPYGLRGMGASLDYYKDAAHDVGGKIQTLITSGKVGPLLPGEYIYGVHVGASYWGCTNDSFFKICPLPPGK